MTDSRKQDQHQTPDIAEPRIDDVAPIDLTPEEQHQVKGGRRTNVKDSNDKYA